LEEAADDDLYWLQNAFGDDNDSDNDGDNEVANQQIREGANQQINDTSIGGIVRSDGACSMCGGLAMLSDEIAFPNQTCADIELAYATTNAKCQRAEINFNAAFEACCRPSIPLYQCEAHVHESLFGDDSDYNCLIPPVVGLDPEERLKVKFHITYQAIESIEETEGTAQLYVSLRLVWKDPRLSWDLNASSTCANMITVYASQDPDTTSIWVPDFDLINQIAGIQEMRLSQAEVYADGTVSWEIVGGLGVFCAFRGLADMPFDELGCQLIFAPYTREASRMIEYDLLDPDYIDFGPFEDKYNEWHVIPELGAQGKAAQGQFIYYNVYFRRATVHFLKKIVIPTAIMTYLSFMTCLMDIREGERMGFAMGLALVVVAQQIITADLLPVTDQNLWMQSFVENSFYFVTAVVVQSVLMGFLFYIREDRETEEQRQADGDREEQEPLAAFDNTAAANRGVAASAVESATGSGKNGGEGATDGRSRWTGRFRAVVYDCPFRKIDVVCCAAFALTYTAWLAYMFIAQRRGSWLVNEPQWISDETPDNWVPIDRQVPSF